MKLQELLEVLDRTEVEDAPKECYKRLYLDIINHDGKRKEKEVSYNKISEVSSSILDLNVVTVEKIYTREFFFSYGIVICLTVI